MLNPSDIISLPCTSDLIESGMACACRSLTQPGHAPAAKVIDHLRLVVVKVAAELAFRRYLAENHLPFSALGASPFSDPDHFDISIGGHRCILETNLISHRTEISRLQHAPDFLLQGPALIPLEQFAAQDARQDDIHLFAFLLGLVAASSSDQERALSAGQPVSLIHPLPGRWRRPSPWVPMTDLVLKSESDQPLSLELFGQDAQRNFISCLLELSPLTRTPVPAEFYSLLCLRTHRKPSARLGIHTPLVGEPHLVSPFDWNNLWVYGMQFLLTGWLTHENYRRKAIVRNPGRDTGLGGRLDQKYLHVPVEELNPLAPLLSRLRAWETNRLHPSETGKE